MHTLDYDSENDCILLRFNGVVSLDTITEVAPQVAQLSEKTGCLRLLNDMSAAQITIAFLELFDSPDIMDRSKITRAIKRALVVPHDFANADMLETLTRNRGHDLRVFHDADTASEWLLEER